jgi:hypothetical protein
VGGKSRFDPGNDTFDNKHNETRSTSERNRCAYQRRVWQFGLQPSPPLVSLHTFPVDGPSADTQVGSHQALPRDEYYALLGVGDLALITPLRDGMNTTSMEFVIAQEKTKRSPSVLSEFMGISKIMEDALQVNPWDLGVGVVVCQSAHALTCGA